MADILGLVVSDVLGRLSLGEVPGVSPGIHLKALGVGLGAFAFVDVEVVRSGLDAPFLVLTGGAAELAARAGVVRWHLSLTHTDLVAMASVLAERDPSQPAGAATGNRA